MKSACNGRTHGQAALSSPAGKGLSSLLMKEHKTNAMRILEQRHIDYEVVEYEVDEEHLDAMSASMKAGLDSELVYKTIVMQGASGQLYVFVTPALFSISMKKARDLTGEKSIDLLRMDQLQKHTGYVRGGCSPLGMTRKYPVFIEELAQLEEFIYVSAGLRGLQLRLKPDDLCAACEGTYASFT